MEIPNGRVLADMIDGVLSSKGHRKLLKAIQGRYPAAKFQVICRGRKGYVEGGIVSADGQQRIADSHKAWVTQAFDLAGGNAQRVFEQYRASGYLMTEFQSAQLCIAIPYGMEADAFFQIEIDAVHEIASRQLFDTDWWPPQNLQQLQNPLLSRLENPMELTPWSYQLANVTDIRRFHSKIIEIERQNQLAMIPDLQKKKVEILTVGDGPATKERHPYLDVLPADWLDAPRRESRLITDWNASSAGKNGHRFSDHWLLEVYDHIECDGNRHLGWMPRLSDKAWKLPRLSLSKKVTYEQLAEKLEKFDRRAGYQMAWYFHTLYGCKADSCIGNRVVAGIQQGKIKLPVNDVEIVLRWYESPYGF